MSVRVAASYVFNSVFVLAAIGSLLSLVLVGFGLIWLSIYSLFISNVDPYQWMEIMEIVVYAFISWLGFGIIACILNSYDGQEEKPLVNAEAK